MSKLLTTFRSATFAGSLLTLDAFMFTGHAREVFQQHLAQAGTKRMVLSVLLFAVWVLLVMSQCETCDIRSAAKWGVANGVVCSSFFIVNLPQGGLPTVHWLKHHSAEMVLLQVVLLLICLMMVDSKVQEINPDYPGVVRGAANAAKQMLIATDKAQIILDALAKERPSDGVKQLSDADQRAVVFRFPEGFNNSDEFLPIRTMIDQNPEQTLESKPLERQDKEPYLGLACLASQQGADQDQVLWEIFGILDDSEIYRRRDVYSLSIGSLAQVGIPRNISQGNDDGALCQSIVKALLQLRPRHTVGTAEVKIDASKCSITLERDWDGASLTMTYATRLPDKESTPDAASRAPSTP